MKIAAVIPARMQSSRLPGKPLLPIAGVPMILRVLERARACALLHRVVVATDSEEIRRLVRQNGGEAWMTSAQHQTGSDRVAEAAAKLQEELILNIQGDEPCLPVSTVDALARFGLANPEFVMATARVLISDRKDILNPNVVKVVCSGSGKALYFSRHPIPYLKVDPAEATGAASPNMKRAGHYKHIGIYLYRRDFLLKLVQLPGTPLECAEGLEQLRALEQGYEIHVVDVEQDSVGVDTPEDLKLAEALILSGER